MVWSSGSGQVVVKKQDKEVENFLWDGFQDVCTLQDRSVQIVSEVLRYGKYSKFL